MNVLFVNFVKNKTKKTMDTAEKRDYIYSYLNQLMDKDVDTVFKTVKAVVEKDLVLSPDQEEELEHRVSLHKSGQSKSYSWSEMRERVRLQA